MKQVKQALSTPMTRKEFLRVFGTGVLALFGVVNFITFLSKTSHVTVETKVASNQQDKGRSGFGSSKFGA